MVLWQSDIRVSWRSQWLSLLLHGLMAAFVLLLPWPLSYTPLWLMLLSLVVFDSVRSQRRINACQGEIKLLMDARLRWQGVEWEIVGTPWMLNIGMVLRLRREKDGRRQHLWLAADSMDAQEWRDLRRLISQQSAQRQH
ncbi:toxin CptA [Phytobacter palmae]|nr:protein YgfX [Escherichia coli]SFE17214.1 toxin CptA [Phytobacter palmae]